jgi:O-antigen biosynthesis protein WbqV
MGEPVRIVDLAKQMIRLAGLEPDRDIDIVYSGLRPGEKLNEEVFHESEPAEPTPQPGIRLASPRAIDLELLEPQIDRLEAVARERNREETLRLVRTLVPEYRSAETEPLKPAVSDS